MKRMIMMLCLLLGSGLALAEGKIAVVNFQQAVLNTDLAQAKIRELEDDGSFKSNLEEAKKIQEEGRKLAEKYQKELPTMSDTQKRDLEKKIQEKQSDLEHIAGKLQDSRQGLMEEVMQELNASATRAVQELIKSEGIGLLLNANPQMVLHADTSFDITAKLTDRLNRIHSQQDKQ